MITVVTVSDGQRSCDCEPEQIADRITPWFPEAPAEVTEAIASLQDAILRGEPAQEPAALLGVTYTLESVEEIDAVPDGVIDLLEKAAQEQGFQTAFRGGTVTIWREGESGSVQAVWDEGEGLSWSDVVEDKRSGRRESNFTTTQGFTSAVAELAQRMGEAR